AADPQVRARLVRAMAQAVRTMVGEGRALAGGDAGPLILWTAALTATYGTELRSERSQRARELVNADEEYYRTVTEAAGPPDPGHRTGSWALRRVAGKALSVV